MPRSNAELEAEVLELRQKLARYEAYFIRIRRDVNLALTGAAPLIKPKVKKSVPVEPISETPSALQSAIDSWMEYKAGSLKAVGKARAVTHIHNVAKLEGEVVVIEALNTAMGNGWKGWDFPDKRKSSNGFKTNGQKKFDITTSAVQRRLEEMDGEICLKDVPF